MEGQFYSALGVIWVFGFVAVMLIVWNMRNKRRMEKLQMIHQERMAAMEKGVPLPEFPEIEDVPVQMKSTLNPRWPLGLGAVFIMAGIGTSIAMRLGQGFEEIWSFGFIGVFLGFGLILYYFLTRAPEA